MQYLKLTVTVLVSDSCRFYPFPVVIVHFRSANYVYFELKLSVKNVKYFACLSLVFYCEDANSSDGWTSFFERNPFSVRGVVFRERQERRVMDLTLWTSEIKHLDVRSAEQLLYFNKGDFLKIAILPYLLYIPFFCLSPFISFSVFFLSYFPQLVFWYSVFLLSYLLCSCLPFFSRFHSSFVSSSLVSFVLRFKFLILFVSVHACKHANVHADITVGNDSNVFKEVSEDRKKKTTRKTCN